MRHTTCKNHLLTFAMAIALVSPLLGVGCSGHVEYRAYDPYYSDYHPWNHDEVVYYQRWEGETHRNHEDFRKRNSDDQKAYWQWRHSQH